MTANKKTKTFHTFTDFFQNTGLQFEKTLETVSRQDENMANNRLFVWNFESADLEEMVDVFSIFKRDTSNENSRLKLGSALSRKMNAMLREEYNPIECMLYASKVINYKLSNDRSTQEILAERIRDIYIKRETETIDILKNIMDMWTWVPQLKVVITAIGLIGENEDLLDLVSLNYGEDENLKSRAFHAFMQNKSISNLKRALKIITNLQNTEEDQIMGRRFSKEVNGFGWDGLKLIEKYNDNPAVSRTGKNVIRKIIRNNSNIIEETNDDEMYMETLAEKSARDDVSFKDFMEDCRERRDRRVCFLCRFSRAEAGQFLKEVLETPKGLDLGSRNAAIISLAILGQKGYTPAAAIIKECYRDDDDNYAPMVAEIILKNRFAIQKLVHIWCQKTDHELYELFGLLKTSNLKYYKDSLEEIQKYLYKVFIELIESNNYVSFEILTGNLQILWDKKLYFIIPIELLEHIQRLLLAYSNGEFHDMPEQIILSMIDTIVHGWNSSVEKVIFSLFHNSENKKVQQMSYKILQSREVQAPK